MGISRDSRHKRRKTGGRRKIHQKKRKFELARPAANTKIGKKCVRTIRVRGGNKKFRALRLDSGNFSWGTQNYTRTSRIIDVVYNASDNELLRTKTLVKNCIVSIDPTPFKNWYETKYKVNITKNESGKVVQEKVKNSKCKKEKLQNMVSDRSLLDQLQKGQIFACVSSRPGQVGRCDGYILEGPELHFYLKKIGQKGSKK